MCRGNDDGRGDDDGGGGGDDENNNLALAFHAEPSLTLQLMCASTRGIAIPLTAGHMHRMLYKRAGGRLRYYIGQ